MGSTSISQRLFRDALQPFVAQFSGMLILNVCSHRKQSFRRPIRNVGEGREAARSGHFFASQSAAVVGSDLRIGQAQESSCVVVEDIGSLFNGEKISRLNSVNHNWNNLGPNHLIRPKHYALA